MDGGFQAVRATGENLQIRTPLKNNTFFIAKILGLFDDLVGSTLLAGGKSKKKDGYLGDPARGQADPGSAAVYTMDWPGPVICMYVLCMCGNGFPRTRTHISTCCGPGQLPAWFIAPGPQN
jgi:hypothetical protein